MQPVDLTTRRSSADRSVAMKSASRAADSATKRRGGRRLRNSRSGRCRHVTLGQPDSAAKPTRRHIDQHQVHCPATERVLLRRRFPARDRDLAAVHAPDPRALDLDLAAVEADPSRVRPTVRPPRRIAAVARPAGGRDTASIIVPSASIRPQGRTDRSLHALLQALRPQPRSPANLPV